MAKKPKQSPASKVHIVEIPIEWRTENTPTVFANQMIVQADDHECYMTFFEIQPPLVVGSEEQKKEQIAAIQSVTAKGVVRIVVSADRLEKFAHALSSTVERIRQEKDKPETNGESKQKG